MLSNETREIDEDTLLEAFFPGCNSTMLEDLICDSHDVNSDEQPRMFPEMFAGISLEDIQCELTNSRVNFNDTHEFL